MQNKRKDDILGTRTRRPRTQYVIFLTSKLLPWLGQARTLELSLDFLEKGHTYSAEIYTDASDTDINPNHLMIQQKNVKREDSLPLPLAIDGGAVAVFTKID